MKKLIDIFKQSYKFAKVVEQVLYIYGTAMYEGIKSSKLRGRE